MTKLLGFILLLLSLSLTAFAVPASLSIPQGAVWNLRERGLTKEAAQLEEYFKNILLNEPITKVAELGGGFTDSHIVQFSNGIVAVIKGDDPKMGIKDSHANEVAAFLVDKAAGLNLIPLTVTREINGHHYSLQLFYSGVDLVTVQNYEGTDFRERIGDIMMLDALIYNVDRDMETYRNIMMGVDGRLVAIDHARTMEEHVNRITYPEGMAQFIPQEVRNRILRIDEGTFKESLEQVLSAEKVEAQIARLRGLKNIFIKLGRGSSRRAVVDSEPLPKKWQFELPKKAKESSFYDRFGLEKALTGPEFSVEQIKSALAAVNVPAARSYAFKLISKNIDRYPEAAYETLASALLSGPYDTYLSTSEATFLKVIDKAPQFAARVLRSKKFENSTFYSVMQVLRNKDAKFMTPEIRVLMRNRFIEFYRESKMSMDINELAGVQLSEAKKTFLKDIYEAVQKAGLSDQIFEIFRLRESRNKDLGLQLLESVNPKDKEQLKNQLTQEYQQLNEKMGASSHFSDDVLSELKVQQVHPLCSKVLVR
jgi:hypothetical protein